MSLTDKDNALTHLIMKQGIVTAPGVYDGLSARLAEEAGFSALYGSGGAIARSTGVPDIGLLTLTEVVERVRQICESTSLPVIADADTGFGNEVNVKRTVELFKGAGVAAFHLEDQEFPKRCGHLDGKSLIAVDEMCRKIEVASKYAGEVVVIARTDAIAVTGFDDAIARANAYVEAGADMLFVEAPQTVQQIEAIARQAPGPKLINMFYGGKTPLVPATDLKAMGYQLIIIPSDLQRAAMTAMKEVLDVIRRDGDSGAVADDMLTFQDRERLVRTKEFLNP
ncbi:oxaloacetate decarboxylase [Endozoicomonas gorgoniicola]|uniref:Oxaloacetate decarboxylase n=1 Tax=Endozoicomonas gorgoniicola TaxID=1234144 RepID=A0ABT3MSW6_9GAMM|nr:oxaloacetate decarboxylase [Endozoicomonas gorgoniicola]MCW7552474.1 oxaloacetate decarboxylase [Endozoicomonas gorgoniicola]